MYKWFSVVLVVAMVFFAFPVVNQPATAHAQSGPMVLAYYYGWFNMDQWNGPEMIDRPAEPYDSTDRGAVSRQIGQAQSAGIDGFVMSWFGPDEPYTTGNFQGLLDQSAAQGFRAAVDVDMGQGFLSTTDSVTNALHYAVNTLGNHSAYLRYNGKPVIFFWNQFRFTPGQWNEIRNAVDPDHNTIWIAEGDALAYIGVFDGLNLYNIAWSANPASTNASWSTRTRNAGGIFVGTAMPGFDESRLGRGSAPVVRGRDNGNFLRASFAGAAAANPHMIIITSWNEFPENSYIEPSANYGTMYLDIARELIASYKASGTVPAVPAAPVNSAASNIPTTSPTGVFAAPTVSGLNVRQGPSTGTAIIGRTSYPNQYPLLGRSADNSWFVVDYGGGQGWVSAQYANVNGDVNAVPVVE